MNQSAQGPRSEALSRYMILDTEPEQAFDGIVALAAHILDVPISTLGFVAAGRVWFKARHGLDVHEVDDTPGFCASAVQALEPYVVEDAGSDPRTASHPLVTGPMAVRFYAAIPIRGVGDQALGSLCVMDRTPRTLCPTQLAALQQLGRQVEELLKLRLAMTEVAEQLHSQQVMAEALPHIVWTATPDGAVEYSAQALYEITGLPADDLSADGWLCNLHPDDRDRALAAWTESVATGKDYAAEFRIRHAGRQAYNWYMVAARPHRDAAGRIARWYGSTIDIHGRILAEQAVRKSELRLRSIFDNEPECVSLISAQHKLLEMNPAGLCMLEADDAAQVIGQPMERLVHPEDKNIFLDLHRKAIAGDNVKALYRVIGLKGTTRWMESHTTPLHNDEGIVESLLSITRDVTLQRRDADLRALESQLLNATSTGTPLADILHQIALAVDRLLPDARASILLIDEGRLRHGAAPELSPAYNAALDGLAIGEGVGSCGTAAWRREPVIVTDIRTDPLWAPYRGLAEQHGLRACWSTPVLDAQGEVLATFALYYPEARAPLPDDTVLIDWIGQFVRVVIERTREHARLRSSEARYHSIFDVVPVSIWEKDWSAVIAMVDELKRQGIRNFDAWLTSHPDFVKQALRAIQVLDVNRFTLTLFEAESKAEFLASLDTVFATADILPSFKGELLALIQGKQSFETELAMQTLRGNRRHVFLRMTFPPPGEDAGRVLVSVTDISARKQAEEQLRQSQRMDAIGQLTGGVAHDFNNLLTVILGNAELLVESLSGNQPLLALAEMTSTAAQRGAELTNRLLAFARRQPLDPKDVEVNRLVQGLDGLLRRTLGEQIDIEMVLGGGLWKALVDGPQLESAILNLCINARDAMPHGGRLTVETANAALDDTYAAQAEDVAPGQYVVVAVSDTGTGMDAKTVAQAFEPFFTTKDVGRGSGLGLSMVYGFAKQSRGHARIYSEPGQGTTVKLYFPRAWGEAVAADELARNDAVPTGSERILLVEDDELVRAHVEGQLLSLGYRVVSVENGDAALEAMRQISDVDLLFTDVVMPGGLSGRKLADEALRLRPGLPVLFTSGYTENAIVHHGRLDRGVHLLQKPYRRQELAAKIRKVLDEAPTTPGQ